MYKVIKFFRDKDNQFYNPGDIYESDDLERIKQLSTNDNYYGHPFIEGEPKKKVRNKKTEEE